MKTKLLLLACLALALLAEGCNPKVVEATEGIEIVSVKLADWENPKDGKTYVVALPTWKNNGKVAVEQVTFSASLENHEKQPANDLSEPQYYGGPVEPGTQVEPKRVPDDGVILGEKSNLANLKESDVVITPIASSEPYKPEKKSDA